MNALNEALGRCFWPLNPMELMNLKKKNLIFMLVLAGATIFMYLAILWKVGSG